MEEVVGSIQDHCAPHQLPSTQAPTLPYGGVSLVAQATGLSRTTIYAGMRELERADGKCCPPSVAAGQWEENSAKPWKAWISSPSYGRAASPLSPVAQSRWLLSGVLSALSRRPALMSSRHWRSWSSRRLAAIRSRPCAGPPRQSYPLDCGRRWNWRKPDGLHLAV